MVKKDVIEISKKFLALVQRTYAIKNAYLFGSYAKGIEHQDSDIDIALIFNDLEDRIDMQIELMKLGMKLDSRIEPHPFAAKNFTLAEPLAYEIIKNGIEIK